ncbi:uroporphyrinogen-III synthase [Crenobacter caeni]|uniref:Uroporphyrinogen-III synthase n=1 Tax=Crenobacter caeni TaxID=2705474 RepID=A0A6B2KM52_9NEIS|nr:uroporphyrinogen-III synthase [Crenobacter caeni]NDV11232.1 uroporphyrinogen-III synthase [Crenobacter caeni]
MSGPLVLLTRPAAQCAALAARVAAAGYTPRPFAPLALAPDPAALARLPGQLADADWLIPVSPGAVDILFSVPDLTLPATLRLACVGRGSAARLATLAGRPVLHPATGSDSEALLALPELQALAGERVLIVRGDTGRALMADTLAARGAQVAFAALYRRVPVDPGWAALGPDQAVSALVVTASEIATALFASAPPARRDWLTRQRFVALHPRVAECLYALGAHRVSVATRADDAALVDALSRV